MTNGPASSTFNLAFREFCDSTSLHGWHQLNRVGNHGKAAWVIIVFSSFTVASFFLATSIVDFVDKSVVTTIETTTASLQEVYFPTVIVCNINQIKKSLFASLRKSSALAGVGPGEIEDLLYHQER